MFWWIKRYVKWNCWNLNIIENAQLVDILNQEVQIDGRIQYVNNAIKIYCKSVLEALNEDDSSLIRFYKIEL